MVACFRHRRRRAAVQRAAARQGSARCGSTSPRPPLVVADERNRAELEARAGADGPVVLRVPDDALWRRARAGAGRRAGRPSDPCLDHLHERHGGRAQGRRARPALPRRPARAGRALARRPARRPRLVHRGQRLVEVGAQRLHRTVDPRRRRAAARRALRPRRAPRRSSSASTSTCSAWRRPSTASSPSARRCGRSPTLRGARRRRRGAQPRGARAPGRRRPACGSATATARPRPAR